MPAAINFDNFSTELMRTIEVNPAIVQESVVYGAESLGNDFTVVQSRDKVALLGLSYRDGWKPATDSFNPKTLVDVKSRFVDFKEGDIDLEFTLSDLKKIYQTYLGWLKAPGRTLADVNANPFEVFFLNDLIAHHFEFIRMETAWNGVYNAAGSGAASLTDGFLTKLIAGRAVGGDIPTSHVFEGDAITITNAYDQFNGVAHNLAAVKPKLLKQTDLNLYASQTAYDKYRWSRRDKFKEHVGPADRPTTLDDYSNINIVVDPGLAGEDSLILTPKKNLLFIANEDPGAFYINIVKQIKSWQITVRASLGFDYATPDWMFSNDQ